MFQFLKNPDFDFMGRRNAVLAFSGILIIVFLGVITFKGLNLGIEFTGGTEIQLKMADAPDLGAIRSRLENAGITNQVVTTIGDPAEHEVYIKLGSSEAETGQQDPIAPVLAVLRGRAEGALPDLNIIDDGALGVILGNAPGLSSSDADRIASRILGLRKEARIFRSHDELAAIDGLDAATLQHLRSSTEIGPMAIRSQSYIGPAIGSELMNKALFAIFGSLAGMLIYIWIRFQLQWGLGAVVALTHDTILVLGLFSLFGKEMSLPVVAAFLTLIGYSVNDTVVVFDRIRENLRSRPAAELEDVINMSINQTLSRTIITSGLTWVVVFGLFAFGGDALRPFSFVLTVGVLVGTYSSIYVASPILVLWQNYISRRQAAAAASGATPAAAKKIRT